MMGKMLKAINRKLIDSQGTQTDYEQWSGKSTFSDVFAAATGVSTRARTFSANDRDGLVSTSPFFLVIEPLINRDREEKVLNDLALKLEQYEEEYQMSSEEFNSEFENGLLPERQEYFEWRLTYRGYMNVLKRFNS